MKSTVFVFSTIFDSFFSSARFVRAVFGFVDLIMISAGAWCTFDGVLSLREWSAQGKIGTRALKNFKRGRRPKVRKFPNRSCYVKKSEVKWNVDNYDYDGEVKSIQVIGCNNGRGNGRGSKYIREPNHGDP